MKLFPILTFFFLYFWGASLPLGQGVFIIEVYISHTTTHHSLKDSSGRAISSTQRPLPENTQHSKQKNFHASVGIRTHVLCSPVAQTHALDRSATETGSLLTHTHKIEAKLQYYFVTQMK